MVRLENYTCMLYIEPNGSGQAETNADVSLGVELAGSDTPFATQYHDLGCRRGVGSDGGASAQNGSKMGGLYYAILAT